MMPSGLAVILLALGMLATGALAQPLRGTVANPAYETYVDEPVRLDVDLRAPATQGNLVASAGGKEGRHHLEADGDSRQLWVAVSHKPAERLAHALAVGRPTPFTPKVIVKLTFLRTG